MYARIVDNRVEMNDVPVSPMKEGVIASLALVMWSVEGRSVNATLQKHINIKLGHFSAKLIISGQLC